MLVAESEASTSLYQQYNKDANTSVGDLASDVLLRGMPDEFNGSERDPRPAEGAATFDAVDLRDHNAAEVPVLGTLPLARDRIELRAVLLLVFAGSFDVGAICRFSSWQKDKSRLGDRNSTLAPWLMAALARQYKDNSQVLATAQERFTACRSNCQHHVFVREAERFGKWLLDDRAFYTEARPQVGLYISCYAFSTHYLYF
jgi:hypothetical protein